LEVPVRARFYTLDVFTATRFAGNPLAVFPDGRGIDGARMGQIAKEFNLSETVFVLPAGETSHSRKLRIFTPAAELPFAGHPTIGTAFLLGLLGEIRLAAPEAEIVFEEGVGPVRVTIVSDGREPSKARLVAPKPPEDGPATPAVERLASALSLDTADLLTGRYGPAAVSCGLPYLFVPLVDRAAVGRMHVDTTEWRRSIANHWAPAIFGFAMDPELPGSHVRARMFAPTVGVDEDPATGSAVAALGGYLGAREPARDGRFRWVIEQGVEMGRPSLLELDVEKRGGQITRIEVGGASVLVSSGSMEV
jgi:trans-2,3-dihydro-3-hydroxyanthranilate isomerase